MSRADWSFLEHLLEEGQEYSTAVGRVWLTVLFLFRMLVLGTAAESAWDDEQSGYVCNTLQPGCTAVCYDKAFPISHFRYFVLQVIFVSTPTIFYFGYVAIRARKIRQKEEEKDEEGGSRTKDNEQEKEKGWRKAGKTPAEAPKLKGRLLCAYALSILFKVLLEVGFIIGLWILYDGFFISPKFECTAYPCPHTVDCFVSRPTEKTVFTIYTQVIAAISLFLNLIELLHLLQLAISHRLEKRYNTQRLDYLPRCERVAAEQQTPEFQTEVSQSYKAGHVSSCRAGVHVRAMGSGIERGGEAVSDMLPSYMNCMGAMRTSHSPRAHYKKHAHQNNVKNSKSAHKGHSKQKQYV
ncbi:gap junction protein alpha 4 [Lates calcarifer]|uniref:Gap junction protein n=1 Tax=Lates calcarifer TaxID=8187 RepID=A0A4W6D335_LATCA|nr:gap junction protein alpha 4 [Lates calcarifer]